MINIKNKEWEKKDKCEKRKHFKNYIRSLTTAKRKVKISWS